MGQLSHPNLLKLIGYCLEDFYPILVYEFLDKGSLHKCLFESMLLIFLLLLCFIPRFFIYGLHFLASILNPSNSHLYLPIVYGTGGSDFQPLSWKMRMKIALDAAKGLAFLHSDEVNVIHGDFRTSHILIDSVSGFIDLSSFKR